MYQQIVFITNITTITVVIILNNIFMLVPIPNKPKVSLNIALVSLSRSFHRSRLYLDHLLPYPPPFSTHPRYLSAHRRPENVWHSRRTSRSYSYRAYWPMTTMTMMTTMTTMTTT